HDAAVVDDREGGIPRSDDGRGRLRDVAARCQREIADGAERRQSVHRDGGVIELDRQTLDAEVRTHYLTHGSTGTAVVETEVARRPARNAVDVQVNGGGQVVVPGEFNIGVAVVGDVECEGRGRVGRRGDAAGFANGRESGAVGIVHCEASRPQHD